MKYGLMQIINTHHEIKKMCMPRSIVHSPGKSNIRPKSPLMSIKFTKYISDKRKNYKVHVSVKQNPIRLQSILQLEHVFVCFIKLNMIRICFTTSEDVLRIYIKSS